MMSFLLLFFALLLIGIGAGIIGGLLGIGGGVITIPCLYLIFLWLDYPSESLMRLSIGTSLAAMVFNTLSATYAHHRKKGVLWQLFKKMAIGLTFGAILGSLLAIWLPEVFLEVFFGIFLCLLAINFLKGGIPNLGFSEVPSRAILNLLSFCIGILSSILGIGGGALTVPLLLAFQIEDKQAIGTSAATTVLVSALGTVSYAIFGWNAALPPGNIGYINLPAFLIVGLTSFLVAPFGVKLTHQLSPIKIRKIFAYVLIGTGLTFIIMNLLHFAGIIA